MFFLKIATCQSTPKFCTYSNEPKKEWRMDGTDERTETYDTQNLPETYRDPPPSPILSNSFFIKIDPPCGIKFAMMIMCPHGFGGVVTGGITCACNYKARIVSLLLPAEKIVSKLTKLVTKAPILN